MTHRSHDGEGGSYERLEFLGDRVLGLTIAEALYQQYPKEAEGQLALRFSALVKAKTLARVAEVLGLGDHLILSRGEEINGSRHKPSLLSDACEALIGALFIDGGWSVARGMVVAHWSLLMTEAVTPPQDARTALQEWAQKNALPLPVYTTLDVTGPGHELVFKVEVRVTGHPPQVGTGPSKRVAGKAAAELLLRTVQ